MVEPHARLNALTEDEARAELTRCCGAQRWVDGMLHKRPFPSTHALLTSADEVWASLGRADYLEAFSHHPQIGADLAALRQKFAATASLSSAEQAGVTSADEETLRALRDGNVAYRERFGFIFIVCATGKSAAEMLALLRARLPNSEREELVNAAAEQAKITKLRLEKLRT